MPVNIGRRELIAALGGAATWPLTAHAQQSAMPVVGFIYGGSADGDARFAVAFRKGLNETNAVEGQNVMVEYHWLQGHYDRLPALMADLINRRVAVIATPASGPAALAAKAATATIPIVFGVAEDPTHLGLVASLARPGGNATGINFFSREVVAKRLRLLHDLVPKAVRIAVLVNPTNTSSARITLQEAQEAAPAIGLKFRYSTPRQSTRSMQPLPRLRASAPMLSSSLVTDSSPAVAGSLPPWRREIGFPRPIRSVTLPRSVG